MLALLADARLPTGGHTQSAGLEPALRAGMPAARVPDYVRARLATVTRTEAATAVVARHAALAP
ncbi:urease accessory protein UreF, partial [Cellulosimicrobium cellulans]|nr:urease accessory protein UreF [Cellulosimicrobium cellulans]